MTFHIAGPTAPNLGATGLYSSGGIGLQETQQFLLDQQYSNPTPCHVCKQPASLQILARDPKFDSATLQKGLFYCEHCLSKSKPDPARYGIRPIRP